VRPTPLRRLGTSAAALFLIGATLLSSAVVVSAADNRVLFIGSPGGANRELSFTPVTAGGLTKTDILVRNDGKQTLTKGHLYIGLAPATELPSGVTVAAVLGPNAGSCDRTDTSVDCDFGNISSKASLRSRSVTVVFAVASAGTPVITAAVKVAESVQDVGSNTNFAVATGAPQVGPASCDSLATFILPNEAQSLLPSDGGPCAADEQRSQLGVPAAPAGNLVALDDSQTGGCPSGYTCFGKAVDASVNGGATVSPYLTWKITYSATLMEGINPRQVGFAHDAVIIPAGKKGQCSAQQTTDCIVGWTVDPASGATTFEIRTKSNGVMKGLG
jgi:hypothetical protein